MLFNSLEFLIFLPLVFGIYYGLGGKNYRRQNWIIVIASYIFYGWWDWRFLFLILFSSLVDYIIGWQLAQTEAKSKRKILLMISLLVNLGLLGFFKYYNFFIISFNRAFTFWGQSFALPTLNLILPVGISFYTFQTMSYTIDIYKKELTPTKDLIAFLAFVSFFPQLAAGPIERAKALLPQFFSHRQFDYASAVLGLKQILWGLFKKIVIADNCGIFVNDFFRAPHEFGGYALLLGLFLFSLQIYGDFSGYSDMALGLARLFNLNLSQNFAFPYFASNIIAFWRRWHLSLTQWFRDYIYFPLGGSRQGQLKTIRNILIIFLVSGLWHGASWSFLFWGLCHALLYLACKFYPGKKKLSLKTKGWQLITSSFKIIFNFILVSFFWVFFRAESTRWAFHYLKHLVKGILTTPMEIFTGAFYASYLSLLLVLGVFLFLEWRGQKLTAVLQQFDQWSRWKRWGCYALLIGFIFYHLGEPQEFIYFQF